MERRRIRVLLVDDHQIVREGIRASLREQEQIDIVGEAANGKAALQKIKELVPEVVLMDLNMPIMGGIAFTVHDSDEYILEILGSGAKGYVLKNTSPEHLMVAIKSVAEGNA